MTTIANETNIHYRSIDMYASHYSYSQSYLTVMKNKKKTV